MKFQFGIEIEAYSETMNHLTLAELLQVDIGNKRNSSCHTSEEWGVYFDRSITHKKKDVYPIELVSPVLQGASSFDDIRKVLTKAKQLANLSTNSTCSIHLHIGVQSLYNHLFKKQDGESSKKEHVEQVIIPFFKIFASHYEDELLAMMAPSRRISKYCNSVKGVQFSEEMSKHFTLAYRPIIHTLEFRMHSGTLSVAKITNWIKIIELVCDNFLTDMEKKPPSILNFLEVPLLTYYNERVKTFQATM